MSRSIERAGVVPAALSFLAIYNPSLGLSDETLEDQIVYYYSKHHDDARTAGRSDDGIQAETGEAKGERDEKLRQIGLAQGMIGFAKYRLCSNLYDLVADRSQGIFQMARQ